MSLLVDMMTDTLDGAYVDAARRRSEEAADVAAAASAAPAGSHGAAAGVTSTTGSAAFARRLPVLALLVALGLVTGVAAAQVRARDAAQDIGRAGLVADVRERTARTDGLAEAATGLQDDVARRRAAALAADVQGRAVAARLGVQELLAGTTAVRGPGVIVTLDDADDASGGGSDRGGRPGDGRVLDRDLQELVNGLWAAGAEAVSINGQRLTALTSIRGAGQAVLVERRPLVPPYVVQAVGDPQTLEPRFVDGRAGRRLATYTSLYGLRFDVRSQSALTLPSAREPELRRAEPAGAGS